jgi:hypothetical protein
MKRDNWDKYRTQRNLVKKIKRKSIREYFIERCVGGPKLKDFWPTIKSFITNKGSYFEIACLSSWFMYGAGCCVLLYFFKGMCLFTTSKKDDSKVSYVVCISGMYRPPPSMSDSDFNQDFVKFDCV